MNDFINPFSVLKATEFSNKEINEYWVDLGNGENSIFHILNPTEFLPKYLIGSKGSGKTHILKYSSYPLQKIRANDNILKLLEDGYIGLHYETYALKISRFKARGVSQEEWESIFEYYIDLYLVENLLNIYTDIFEGLSIENNIQSKICLEIFKLFNESTIITPFDTLDGLIKNIDILRRNVDSEINNVAFTKNLQYENVKSLFNPGDLIFRIPEIVANNIKPLENIKIIYIIDEFEKFEEWQKKYFNTLIFDKKAPVSFWIGMRTWGYTTLDTKTASELKVHHEVKIINLDERNSKNEKEYKEFAEKLYLSRLQKYYQKNGLKHKIVLKSLIEDKFEKYDENKLIDYFENYHKKLKHISELESKLEQAKIDQKEIQSIIELLLLNAINPLLQKYKFFRFYYLWNKQKKEQRIDFVNIAQVVNQEFEDFRKGKKNIFSEIKDKRKKDLIAQLCFENNEVSKNIEHSGIDSLIDRSQCNPRNLLMLLMKCVEYGNVRGENPLKDNGYFSVETQYYAIHDTAKWFYETIEVKGDEAKRVFDSIYFMTEILKVNRYCDKPSETNVFGFNLSPDDLSVNSRSLLKTLESHSVIIPDENGRKEKNTNIKEDRYNVNKILCPLWGLPITKRGVLDFNYEIANIIFDYEYKDKFDSEYKKIRNKLNAPFGIKGKEEDNKQLSKNIIIQQSLF